MSSCQIGSVVFHSSYSHKFELSIYYCILVVLLKISSNAAQLLLHVTIHCCCSSYMFDRVALFKSAVSESYFKVHFVYVEATPQLILVPSPFFFFFFSSSWAYAPFQVLKRHGIKGPQPSLFFGNYKDIRQSGVCSSSN